MQLLESNAVAVVVNVVAVDAAAWMMMMIWEMIHLKKLSGPLQQKIDGA